LKLTLFPFEDWLLWVLNFNKKQLKIVS